MKFFSVTELGAIGKGAIAFILTAGGLLQVPEVSSKVFKLANLHPHIATILGAMTTLAALLANPRVQKLLGYTATVETDGDVQTKQETTVTKEG